MFILYALRNFFIELLVLVSHQMSDVCISMLPALIRTTSSNMFFPYKRRGFVLSFVHAIVSRLKYSMSIEKAIINLNNVRNKSLKR